MRISLLSYCLVSISRQILGPTQVFEEQAALSLEIEERPVHIIDQNTSFYLFRYSDLWRSAPVEREAEAALHIDTDAHRIYGFDIGPWSQLGILTLTLVERLTQEQGRSIS
jgi:hypothetical protein